MGVASDSEIGGVGRLMMFGPVVFGMVMVAVVRVVEIVIFLFKFAYFHSHFIKLCFTAIPVLQVSTSFFFCPTFIKLY